MHVIINAKIDFLRFWLCTFFFCWKNPGGSIRKNGNLTDHVFSAYRALLFLMESAKNHVLKTVNQTVDGTLKLIYTLVIHVSAINCLRFIKSL